MPTDEELRAGAGFIGYEHSMLAHAAQLWGDRGFARYSKQNKWERRMVTDTFLLHARNLIDFLAPRPNARCTDVLARHYNPSWELPGTSALVGRTIHAWRGQIDKLLSHVTYERTALIDRNAPSPRWPIEELRLELTTILGDFLKTLPQAQREWFGLER